MRESISTIPAPKPKPAPKRRSDRISDPPMPRFRPNVHVGQENVPPPGTMLPPIWERAMPRTQAQPEDSYEMRSLQDPLEYPAEAWFDENFSHPWNRAPLPGTRETEMRKLMNLGITKFDGRPENYILWRNQVITCIHSVCAPMRVKYTALAQTIDTKRPQLLNLITPSEPTAQAYAKIIIDLGKSYGGKSRQLDFYLNELERAPDVRLGDYTALEFLFRAATSYRDTATAAGRPQSFYSDTTLRLMIRKLPEAYAEKYVHWTKECDVDHFNPQHLLTWMEDKMESIRTMEEIKAKKATKFEPRKINPYNRNLITWDQEQTSDCEEEEFVDDGDYSSEGRILYTKKAHFFCKHCKEKHRMVDCDWFKQISPAKRREFAKENLLCFNCLSSYHVVKNCPSPHRCKCGKKHHNMLHPPMDKASKVKIAYEDGEDDEQEEILGEEEVQEEPLVTLKAQTQQRQIISLRTAPVIIQNLSTGEMRRYIALLDDGSQSTLISQKVVSDLNLQGTSKKFSLFGICNEKQTHDSLITKVKFMNDDQSASFTTQVRSIPDPVGDLTPVEWNHFKGNWKHLKNLQFPDLMDTKCEVLIGATDARSMSGPDVKGGPADPVARQTMFGWTALGRVFKDEFNNQVEQNDVQNINEAIKSMMSRIRDRKDYLLEIS